MKTRSSRGKQSSEYRWKKQKRLCYISWQSRFFRHVASWSVLGVCVCVCPVPHVSAMLITPYLLPGSKSKPPPRHAMEWTCKLVMCVLGVGGPLSLLPFTVCHLRSRRGMSSDCHDFFPTSGLVFVSLLRFLSFFISLLFLMVFNSKSLSVSSFLFVVLNSVVLLNIIRMILIQIFAG